MSISSIVSLCSAVMSSGNVKLSNLEVLNAFLYVAEYGCKWRGLPERFGKWQAVYRRVRRWSRKGVLDEILQALH